LTNPDPPGILNHMVDDRSAALDRVFRALASAPRREILRRVAAEQRTVTDLAEHFDLTLAAVSKHIRVLEEARLVARTKQGRLHWYRLVPEALQPARASIDAVGAFWSGRLQALESLLREEGRRTKRRRAGARR
jgi:DNA-binding transcriptional ArsR family regulator